jgi:hypothetical protein
MAPNNHGPVENPKLNSTLILIAVKHQMVVSMKVSPATAQQRELPPLLTSLPALPKWIVPIRGLFSAPNLTPARDWLTDAFAGGWACLSYRFRGQFDWYPNR